MFCCARHLRPDRAQIKLEVKAEAIGAMVVHRFRQCGADGVQGIERFAGHCSLYLTGPGGNL